MKLKTPRNHLSPSGKLKNSKGNYAESRPISRSPRLDNYATLVFDCDGVVLNSNTIKTRAFYVTAIPYGKKAAEDLVHYHVKNGGISRYLKFEYFLRNILNKQVEQKELHSLLTTFSQEVLTALLTCEVASALKQLRKKTPRSRWMIVSGGDQNELRYVFNKRGMTSLFNGGIFGSPDTKDTILAYQLKKNNIVMPALYLGDSKYDFQAATRAGLDFMFLSGWSEFHDWQKYFDTDTPHISKLKDLLCSILIF